MRETQLIQRQLIHGGDRESFRRRYGFEPMDFSANISPLGMPPSVKDAIIEAICEADGYPDPLCRELVSGIAAAYGTDEAFIMCGNGAAELIFRMAAALKPKKALVTAPAFYEYEAALKQTGCGVKKYRLTEENDFRLDGGFIDAISEDTDLVILCQPNNPTGVTDKRELLMRILKRCGETGAVLMVDECFNDFLERPELHTMTGSVRKHKNLIILRSFTKIYAMAGVRLGFCICSDQKLLGKMREAGQPWSVSHMAQRAGVAALHETEYVKSVRRIVKRERRRLAEGLSGMGFRVVCGEANYLLFKGRPGLDTEMEKRGFLIRNCSNYDGLGEGWYRIAVRTSEENDKLMKALEEALR